MREREKDGGDGDGGWWQGGEQRKDLKTGVTKLGPRVYVVVRLAGVTRHTNQPIALPLMRTLVQASSRPLRRPVCRTPSRRPDLAMLLVFDESHTADLEKKKR